MGRDADGAAVVGQGPGHRLANPPRGVGAEAVAAPIVVLLDRLHQADVALLNQVQELEAAAAILLGDADHQTGIGADEVGARGVANLTGVHQAINLIEIGDLLRGQPLLGGPPGFDLHRQLHLFLGRQQLLLPHLAEVEAHRVINRHVAQVEQGRVVGRSVGRTPIEHLFGDLYLDQAIVRLVVRRAKGHSHYVVLVLVNGDPQRLRFFQESLEQRNVILNLRQRFQDLVISQIALFDAFVEKRVKDFHFVGQWIVQISHQQIIPYGPFDL